MAVTAERTFLDHCKDVIRGLGERTAIHAVQVGIRVLAEKGDCLPNTFSIKFVARRDRGGKGVVDRGLSVSHDAIRIQVSNNVGVAHG